MTARPQAATEDGTSALAVVDAQSYRKAMARVPTAVAVITTIGPQGPFGFTASAVTSVTDTPATLLVCVNQTTQTFPVITACGRLAVNVLAAADEPLAKRFAGGVKDMAARFEGVDWYAGPAGSPLLRSALVAFDCVVVREIAAGTHAVFLCEVTAVVEAEAGTAGLLYVDRAFRTL